MKVFIAIVAAAALAGAGIVAYRSAQSDDEFAVKVGGRQITEEQVERAMKTRQRQLELDESVPPGTSATADKGAVVQQLIDDALFSQRAKELGLTCSEEEALRTLDGIPDEAMALAAYLSGMAPEGYLDVPEAERTPATAELIDQYRSDPGTLAQLREDCAQSKLYATLGDAGEDGVLTNDERNTAIRDLRDTLAAKTVIERKPGY